jgi:hypothetical protein
MLHNAFSVAKARCGALELLTPMIKRCRDVARG